MTEDVPPVPGIDLGRLQAEINEEVRHRRATGDFPPGLERELDAMFARYAPAGTGDDFDDVLASAQTQSFIHADVPTSSRRAPFAIIKRALRMAMAWYVRFVAQQVTAFAGTITRAVGLLARRVDALETLTVSPADRAVARRDLSPWADIVVTALAGIRGRVLLTECGDGALIRSMLSAGLDAYGVEPSEELTVEAAGAGLDVRTDTAIRHLRKVPDESLAAVVLSVDTLPTGEVVAIAGRAVDALAPGGTLMVLSAGPLAWARSVDPVATRSTMQSATPSRGVISTAPETSTISAATPASAKYPRVSLGKTVATRVPAARSSTEAMAEATGAASTSRHGASSTSRRISKRRSDSQTRSQPVIPASAAPSATNSGMLAAATNTAS